jgi:2-succinyl-6-hydroxy-2,4-cyclohexadiene-1-carboxylate synthase
VAQALRYTVPSSSVRDRVAENTVPTLLVAGHRERAFAEPRAFAAENMPNLEVVDLDGGHAVNINAATEFNEAVCSFFGRFGPLRRFRSSPNG